MTAKTVLRRIRERLVALPPQLSYALGRKAPALVSIDVSGDCNLRCVMCSLEEANPGRGMMPMAAFEALVEQLDGNPIIELSSGCEPTLNPHLPQMLRVLRRRHPAAFVELTTNATVLGDEIIAALIDSRTDKLMISLDAGEPKAYEAIRVHARFERVVANVRRLVLAKAQAASERPALEVIFTLMSVNAGQLIPLLDLLADIGISSLTVNGLVPFSKPVSPMAMWGVDEEPAEVVALARRAAAHAHARGVRMLFPELASRPVARCVDCNPVISWDGDVFPCFMTSFARTFHHHGRAVAMPRIVLGNVRREPLARIWRSPRAVAFRAPKAAGQLPEFCRGCAMQMGILCPSRTIPLEPNPVNGGS